MYRVCWTSIPTAPQMKSLKGWLRCGERRMTGTKLMQNFFRSKRIAVPRIPCGDRHCEDRIHPIDIHLLK
jgi:hypothetical protein